MIDVDFRYVMRQEDTGGEHFDQMPMEKVLQYRKLLPIVEQSTKHLPVPYITGYSWTDWQDVRVEEE